MLGRLDIRDIYRHLLWESARSGLPRKSHETNREYARRVQKVVPIGREQLAQITDLYTDVRYGEITAPKEQVDNANILWKALRTLIRGLRGD